MDRVKILMTLYPLRFESLLRRYIWGGRRFATTLQKPLPPGEDYAESWELVDRRDVQSTVRFGPLQGMTLHQLGVRYGQELLGTEDTAAGFPLLFKFIDAQHDLSVQVHPDDELAAAFDPPDRGKTEAWVVLHAEPGSILYAGLNPEVDRQRLEKEIRRGNVEACLHRFSPRVGDCFLIPAGVVHAIGAGLLIAEIQQASDTTFRLYDWNRLDAAGQSRPLHVEQAFEAIDFEAAPVVREDSTTCPSVDGIESLIRCEKFVLDRWHFEGSRDLGGDGRFHIVTVLGGQLMVSNDPAKQPLQIGQTCLIPAASAPVQLIATEPVTLLNMYLP